MEPEASGTSGRGKVTLPPLKHVEGGYDIGPALPAIAKVTPTQGGMPVQSEAGIISVPEGCGALPSKTEAGIISVQGAEDPVGVAHARAQAQHPSKALPLQIVVYFEDKTGIDLSVEDGQHAEAGELFEIIMDEMKFPAVARDVFSLWLVSDLLELQLKPNQIPFKLVFFWEELLEKYTTTPEEDAERDEPVLVFRRNVFCSRVKDQRIEDPALLRLLYAEAKENIIDARYPISQKDCDTLAGIQALIEHTTYLRDEHTAEYYKSKLSNYYPEHFCKRKVKLFRRHPDPNPEDRLVTSHYSAAKKYGTAISDGEKKVCYKAYLDYCWKLPYYGAAFFRGQIEHPSKKLRLMSMTDDPVFVAINTEGVFIIDLDDVEFLMGLIYEQLKWEFALPKNPEDRNCMPCLFLQFSASADSGRNCTKVLQIFSRQGALMDGLISACIKLKRQTRAEDQLDGAMLDTVDGKQDGVIESGGETWMKFNRLCLTTFDCKGKLLSTSARVPKVH